MIITVNGQQIAVRLIDGSDKYAVTKGGGIYARHSIWKQTWITLHPYIKNRRNPNGKMTRSKTLYVHIDKIERPLHRVVWETFVGTIPKNKVLYHRNGNHEDNSLENLELISLVRLGEKTGGKCAKRAVAKVDRKGNVLDVYRSAREAGRQNYMSGTSVADRCNGKVRKNEFAIGYSYRWEDSVHAEDEEAEL